MRFQPVAEYLAQAIELPGPLPLLYTVFDAPPLVNANCSNPGMSLFGTIGAQAARRGKRRTFPGSAPVCSPPSITTSPLTRTVEMPEA